MRGKKYTKLAAAVTWQCRIRPVESGCHGFLATSMSSLASQLQQGFVVRARSERTVLPYRAAAMAEKIQDNHNRLVSWVTKYNLIAQQRAVRVIVSYIVHFSSVWHVWSVVSVRQISVAVYSLWMFLGIAENCCFCDPARHNSDQSITSIQLNSIEFYLYSTKWQ